MAEPNMPANAKKTASRASGSRVRGTVTIETNSFDANKPELIEKAQAEFENQAGSPLDNVTLSSVKHDVGFSAEYTFDGTVK